MAKSAGKILLGLGILAGIFYLANKNKSTPPPYKPAPKPAANQPGTNANANAPGLMDS